MPSPPASAGLLPDAVAAALPGHADAADRVADWPAASWDLLIQAGVLEWSIPSAHGGRELDSVALLLGYERLAAACLTTAFILSQRDAAVRRIRDSGRDDLG